MSLEVCDVFNKRVRLESGEIVHIGAVGFDGGERWVMGLSSDGAVVLFPWSCFIAMLPEVVNEN
jgi:hypothetical protein